MIAKLKKKLVLQYTLIIVVLLACLSALAIAAIRYNNSIFPIFKITSIPVYCI